MKKTLLFCSLLLLPAVAAAAESSPLSDEQQRQQIQENIDKIGQEINHNIKEAGKQLNAAIPALADNITSILNSFTSEMVPIIKALEENRNLLTASDSMAEALKDSLPPQYRQELKYEIDSKNNQLTVDGKIIENEDIIRFNLIRNLAAASVIQSFITETNEVETANFFNPGSASLPKNKRLHNLDNKQLPFDEFKLELINNQAFMVHESEKETFIFGNLNPALTLTAQSSGHGHAKKIREFIATLDLPKMNQAISQNHEKKLNLTIQSPDTQK